MFDKDSLDAMLARRLVINMGKGGVGRSFLSAALAKLAAEQGKRVLICEINTKERMGNLLGGTKPPNLDSNDQIWQVKDNIWTVNIDNWLAMKEYILQILRLRLIYNLIFENQVIKGFLRGIPGLQELINIGKIWYHVEDDKIKKAPRFDLVIVDAPATGHGVALVRISQVILELSPPGPMLKAAKKIDKLLKDPDKTWINLISLPEEMPVNETIELHSTLREQLNLPAQAVWINQWPTRLCSPHLREKFEEKREEGLGHSEIWPVWAAGGCASVLEDKGNYYFDILKEHITLPLIKIPRLASLGRPEQELVNEALDIIRKDLGISG